MAAAIALHAMKSQEGRFEEVSKLAVERASDPFREATNRQVEILKSVAEDFENAATESRKITDARDALVSIMQELREETRPLVADMRLTRQIMEEHAQTSQTAYSPALLAVAGSAILVSGIAIGMTVMQALI